MFNEKVPDYICILVIVTLVYSTIFTLVRFFTRSNKMSEKKKNVFFILHIILLAATINLLYQINEFAIMNEIIVDQFFYYIIYSILGVVAISLLLYSGRFNSIYATESLALFQSISFTALQFIFVYAVLVIDI